MSGEIDGSSAAVQLQGSLSTKRCATDVHVKHHVCTWICVCMYFYIVLPPVAAWADVQLVGNYCVNDPKLPFKQLHVAQMLLCMCFFIFTPKGFYWIECGPIHHRELLSHASHLWTPVNRKYCGETFNYVTREPTSSGSPALVYCVMLYLRIWSSRLRKHCFPVADLTKRKGLISLGVDGVLFAISSRKNSS